MAVLTASGLRKEFSGDPLFDGVSFRLRRGDRLALAGANGAGKTTLLRALIGETSLTSGELAFAKDTRVALHDQRPPRGQGLTLREYSLSGAGDLVAIEKELTRLEQAMATGDHAPASARRSPRRSRNDTPSKRGSPENSFRRPDAVSTAIGGRVGGAGRHQRADNRPW